MGSEMCIRDRRKLDHLLRLTNSEKPNRLSRLLEKDESNLVQLNVVNEFLAVSDQVSTRVLLQLLGHLGRRNTDSDKRIVFPKGNTQKAVVLRQTIEALDNSIIDRLTSGINATLIEKFSAKDSLGRVWICLLYTSPSPRDLSTSRMPSSA